MVAGLVILWAVRLCERRSPSPLLGEWLWCKEPPGCRGLLPVYTTKFVSITSDGPPLSSGIGFALKCSSISKMLWNQRCWTRHWPSTLSASLRCCKNPSITLLVRYLNKIFVKPEKLILKVEETSTKQREHTWKEKSLYLILITCKQAHLFIISNELSLKMLHQNLMTTANSLW